MIIYFTFTKLKMLQKVYFYFFIVTKIFVIIILGRVIV